MPGEHESGYQEGGYQPGATAARSGLVVTVPLTRVIQQTGSSCVPGGQSRQKEGKNSRDQE